MEINPFLYFTFLRLAYSVKPQMSNVFPGQTLSKTQETAAVLAITPWAVLPQIVKILIIIVMPTDPRQVKPFAGAVFERTLQMPIGPSSEKSKSYYPWQQILF
jgi:hypothetical protein